MRGYLFEISTCARANEFALDWDRAQCSQTNNEWRTNFSMRNSLAKCWGVANRVQRFCALFSRQRKMLEKRKKERQRPIHTFTFWTLLTQSKSDSTRAILNETCFAHLQGATQMKHVRVRVCVCVYVCSRLALVRVRVYYRFHLGKHEPSE